MFHKLLNQIFNVQSWERGHKRKVNGPTKTLEVVITQWLVPVVITIQICHKLRCCLKLFGHYSGFGQDVMGSSR